MDRYGKYDVIEEIGKGGFGVVYRGQDPYLKRPVAIKTCTVGTREDRLRFFREAEIAANLQHPNITLVYDFGFHDEVPYFVQEYLTGQDLSEVIKAKSISGWEERVDILAQVAAGLAHAHDQGVIHRDVKPANIRVLDDGKVKIMDFGIARVAESEDTKLTRTGFSVGTAAYLAPEQIEGSEVDARADIFSFGCVAYELVTYTRAFAGPTVSAMMYQILHIEPAAARTVWPDCPPRLEGVVRGCLRKDPTARFASLQDVHLELTSILAELRGETPSGSRLSESPPTEQVGPGQKGGATAPGRDPTGDQPTRTIQRRPVAPRREVAEDSAAMAPVRGWSRRALPWTTGAALLVVSIALALALMRREPAPPPDLSTPPSGPPTAQTTGDPLVEPVAGEPAPGVGSPPDAADAGAVRATVAPTPIPAGGDLSQLVEEARSRAVNARARAMRDGAPELAPQAFAAAEEQQARAGREADRAPSQAAVRSYWEASELFARAAESARQAEARPTLEVAATATGSGAPDPVDTLGSGVDDASRPSPGPAEAPPVAAAPAAAPSPPAAETAAPVTPAPDPRAGVRTALGRYEAAYEARDAAAVRAIWPGIDADRLQSIERAFGQFRSLEMDLTGCEITIEGERATAACRVRQRVQLTTGDHLDNEHQTEFRLQRRDQGWVIVGL